MVKNIFDYKVVERNDTENRMKFPRDADLRHLPFLCSSPGQSATLQVKDEEGTQWTLTYQNVQGNIYFTDGWKVFREQKGITDGHKIRLYKDDDYFGSGAQYRIEVMKR